MFVPAHPGTSHRKLPRTSIAKDTKDDIIKRDIQPTNKNEI